MLYDVCAEIRNWFCSNSDKYYGRYAVVNGNIAPSDFLADGQYFRIVGSAMNDGVYQHPASGLIDEEFDGALWAMRVPPTFVSLVDEITEYKTKNKENGFSSESFGGYSYTRRDDASWQSVFAKRLNAWRKL